MTPALGKWLGPGTIRGVWSPTLGTGPALPFWHWMWWTQFTVPPGDGTGVRQVTAGGRSTNATGVRHPCDVDDEPREIGVTVNLCDFAPLDPQPTPADGGGDLTVEPVPDGWPDHYEWHLLDCGGGAVHGPIVTGRPTLTEDDLPPHAPQAQPVWHSGRVRVTGVREANGGDTPHEIRVSREVQVCDPCTGRPRCGGWRVTSYFAPIEGPLTGETRGETMPLQGGGSIIVHDGFRAEVFEEGWGLLGSDHPTHPNTWVGHPVRNAGVWEYEFGDGPTDRHGNPLSAFSTLATDQGYNWSTDTFTGPPPAVIADGKSAGFYYPPENGHSGGTVCGTSRDHGPAIVGNRIDVYVGEFLFWGSGQSTYVPVALDPTEVSVEP